MHRCVHFYCHPWCRLFIYKGGSQYTQGSFLPCEILWLSVRKLDAVQTLQTQLHQKINYTLLFYVNFLI